jgi:hypothetical protein
MMHKLAALFVFGMVLSPLGLSQDDAPPNPEMQHAEIVNLEKEAARAIQLNSGTFFRRVYSDDYEGTLSHGVQVNKAKWIEAIESSPAKYQTFRATDIKVRIFQDTAIATCLWSATFVIKDQHFSAQMRAIHVYINTPRGWHVVSGQITNLPPDVHQPI